MYLQPHALIMIHHEYMPQSTKISATHKLVTNYDTHMGTYGVYGYLSHFSTFKDSLQYYTGTRMN